MLFCPRIFVLFAPKEKKNKKKNVSLINSLPRGMIMRISSPIRCSTKCVSAYGSSHPQTIQIDGTQINLLAFNDVT